MLLTHRLSHPVWSAGYRSLQVAGRMAAQLGRVIALLWSTSAPPAVLAADGAAAPAE